MKKIGVLATFLEEQHKEAIQNAVAACNRLSAAPAYSVTFYATAKQLEDEIHLFDILYGYIPAPMLKKAANLKWLQAASAGVDALLSDDLYAHPESLILTNSNGAYGITISEHMIMVSLMLLRRQLEYGEVTARREWKNLGTIRSIYGSRIVVVGTGDIGTHFAKRAKAMGAAHITGVRRTAREADPAFDEIVTLEHLGEVVQGIDLLALCVPGTHETKGLLSAEIIEKMGPQAYVVNVGRGSAIDQEALIAALNEGRLSGAALDVMTPEPLPADSPLYDAKNILLTPHISGNMTLGKTCDLNVGIFTRNLLRYAKGEPLHHLVDRQKGY